MVRRGAQLESRSSTPDNACQRVSWRNLFAREGNSRARRERFIVAEQQAARNTYTCISIFGVQQRRTRELHAARRATNERSVVSNCCGCWPARTGLRIESYRLRYQLFNPRADLRPGPRHRRANSALVPLIVFHYWRFYIIRRLSGERASTSHAARLNTRLDKRIDTLAASLSARAVLTRADIGARSETRKREPGRSCSFEKAVPFRNPPSEHSVFYLFDGTRYVPTINAAPRLQNKFDESEPADSRWGLVHRK